MLRPRILDCEPIPGDVPETLYRDEDVWIVDKPAGWLTHSDGAMNRPAVTDWCGESVGIHQRLDVDTTGVLAMSRSRAGAARLQEAFENRTARKRYLAVVEQWTGPMQGSIRRPVPEAPDKDAETHYRVLQSGIFGTLMELTPVTGRRHQLR